MMPGDSTANPLFSDLIAVADLIAHQRILDKKLGSIHINDLHSALELWGNPTPLPTPQGLETGSGLKHLRKGLQKPESPQMTLLGK